MRSLFFILLLTSLPTHAQVFHYDGEMGSVSGTGKPCTDIFYADRYSASHHTAGATDLISVVNFKSPMPNAFFHNMTLLGRLGPDGDIAHEKTLVLSNREYRLQTEGLMSPQFLWLKINVEIVENGNSLCTGSGEFSGFH